MPYTAMLLSLSLLVSVGAVAGRALAAEANKTSQTISRAGSLASITGPAEFFTGNVRIDPLFPANDAAPFSGGVCHLRARGQIRLAHSPDRAAPDRDRWRWPDTGMGRPDRGNHSGRRDLVPATGQTLARRLTHHRHDAYRHYGNNQREKR